MNSQRTESGKLLHAVQLTDTKLMPRIYKNNSKNTYPKVNPVNNAGNELNRQFSKEKTFSFFIDSR